ncbi:hypothetical protein O6H91_02G001400 [Diphasiastrum complanatum]|uniref:Uncharacterized protein n=1 Tax=Diphasiastrum complanatum TaxID=34168 RepID=A0ACC2EC54_DIPCM|nr:hypothetical protein O6H91_02G001400 [Diphasiastrum complanatum]
MRLCLKNEVNLCYIIVVFFCHIRGRSTLGEHSTTKSIIAVFLCHIRERSTLGERSTRKSIIDVFLLPHQRHKHTWRTQYNGELYAASLVGLQVKRIPSSTVQRRLYAAFASLQDYR